MEIRHSPHFNDRPEGVDIDTFVVHSMYFDPECRTLECIEHLARCEVSSHYLISREGEVWHTVPENLRAWHAGISAMPFHDDQRENVNHFSIGAELITPQDMSVTDAQYIALATLIKDVASRHSIRNVVGHDHISPDRKTDPGPDFDWARLQKELLPMTFRIPGLE